MENKHCPVLRMDKEILHAMTEFYLTPNTVSLDTWVMEKLDINLEASFDGPLYIVYQEYVTEFILDLLHKWISGSACNRDNIVLITETAGIQNYYTKYCEFNRTKPLKIVEAPAFLGGHYTLPVLKSVSSSENTKQIEHVYSYFGGTYETDFEKTLAFILLYNPNIGYTERLFEFGDKRILERNLEILTEYMDVDCINSVLDKYDSLLNTKDSTFAHIPGKKHFVAESMNYFWSIDNKCFANVIRETSEIVHPGFTYFSEKTARCFFNNSIPVPLSGADTNWLNELGYWIPDIVDYGYLKETNTLKRLQLVVKEMTRLSTLNLTDYYNENWDNILHNRNNLLYNHWEIIKKRIDEVI